LRDLAGPHDQRKNQGKRERQHDRARGERGRDAVREQFASIEHTRTGGGKDNHEYAESKRAAQLMGNVDDLGRCAGVFGSNAGYAQKEPLIYNVLRLTTQDK
jgi:hypothetical protein